MKSFKHALFLLAIFLSFSHTGCSKDSEPTKAEGKTVVSLDKKNVVFEAGLWVNLEKIEWTYTTEEGNFSSVSVKIKGTTNAQKLTGQMHGDGLLQEMEIAINNDKTFECTIPVAFSHIPGVILGTDSELKVYDASGRMEKLELKNPRS